MIYRGLRPVAPVKKLTREAGQWFRVSRNLGANAQPTIVTIESGLGRYVDARGDDPPVDVPTASIVGAGDSIGFELDANLDLVVDVRWIEVVQDMVVVLPRDRIEASPDDIAHLKRVAIHRLREAEILASARAMGCRDGTRLFLDAVAGLFPDPLGAVAPRTRRLGIDELEWLIPWSRQALWSVWPTWPAYFESLLSRQIAIDRVAVASRATSTWPT